MIYRIAADAVVVVHFGFVLFAVLGGWLVCRRAAVAWLHVPALLWGLWIELSHRICPLTPLENRLRDLAGDRGYSGGFIEHYLVPLIYPPGLRAGDQLFLAALLAAINLAAYGFAVRQHFRRSRVCGPGGSSHLNI